MGFSSRTLEGNDGRLVRTYNLHPKGTLMSTSLICKTARHGLFAAAIALAAGTAHASWFSELTFSNFKVSWSGYQTFDGAPSDGLAHTMSIPDRKFPDGSGDFSIGGITGDYARIELSGTMEIHGSIDRCGASPGGPYDFAFLRFSGSAGMASFENPPAFYLCDDAKATKFQDGRTFSIAWENFNPGEFIQAEAQATNAFSFTRTPPVPESATYWLLLTGLAPLALMRRRHAKPAAEPTATPT